MKTMQNGSSIVRIKDESASSYFKRGYRFVPKSVWKKEVRDIKVTSQEKINTEEKANKPSKAQKKQAKKH